MSITVICPLCGGKTLAPSQLIGRMAKCPQCGQTIKVIPNTSAPTPCDPPDKHAEGDPIPTAAPRNETPLPSARPRFRYGLVLTVSAMALVILLIAGFWFGPFGAVFQRVDSAARHTDPDRIANAAGTARAAETDEAAWADASKGPVQQGDVRVQVAAIAVRNIKVKDLLGEESVPATKYLTISIHLENTNATHKIDFLGWSAAASRAAILEDDSGKRYQPLCLGPDVEILGQVRTAVSVDPGKALEDLLVFEPPMSEIHFLRLELPAAFGGTGSLRFQIPKEMIFY